jgi:spermidine/putrescine transport system ATP-binding protein
MTKRFGDVVAVDNLSLEVPHGSFFALLGPSGCGKTTTLRVIGGFEDPTSGSVFLGDRDVTRLPPYRRDANTVFQNYALFPHLTTFDNIAFGLRERRVSKAEIRTRVNDVIELMALDGLARRKPREMSGGQQQRVALARALVNRPRVLLLDEPLGALDLKLRRQMQLELKRIQSEVGITFIHVTHDQEEAMTMADTVAVMNHGVIEQLGSPSELYERPRTAFVAGFLGISNLLPADIVGPDRVRLKDGGEVAVPSARLAGQIGAIAIGIRPEKLSIARSSDSANQLRGTVTETAYIGASTQYAVETGCGRIVVYVQNVHTDGGQFKDHDEVVVAWDPNATFVVDHYDETTAKEDEEP